MSHASRILPPLLLLLMIATAAEAGTLRGRILDADTGSPLPARLYVQGESGEFHHVESATEAGRAVPYDVVRFETSVEIHTSVSAHPFEVKLPPGRYTVSAHRGHEWHPATAEIDVPADETVELELELRRWIDLAARGWYSGDTHVHRTVEELETALPAEDLNVALPLTYWVTEADRKPIDGDMNQPAAGRAELIRLDDRHAIWTMNTEYELFTVDGESHVQGAFFVLDHGEPLEQSAPPVAPVGVEARRQGALIDMDKPNWPWSMMLVPVLEVDLFELANNHLWRTEFGFRDWRPLPDPPPFMDLEIDEQGFTERGWVDFGFESYYMLLNCGFRLRPSAGTASGVHPVPLGFGRVYVHTGQPALDYRNWINGLDAGRSFVTTGPMLLTTIDGDPPGAQRTKEPGQHELRIEGTVHSAHPIDHIEILVNGQVAQTLPAENIGTDREAYRSQFQTSLAVEQTSWVAVRCFENRSDDRVRFAHTAPTWIDMPGRPLQPDPEAVDWLIERVEAERKRHRDVLPPEALQDYERALTVYRDLAEQARQR